MALSGKSWLFVLFALVTPSAARANPRETDLAKDDALASFAVESPLPQSAGETFARETFRITAVNTGEFVDVDVREGVATQESVALLTHLFRCLRTQTEHEPHPRLVAALVRIARESGRDLELVSGYRAPLWARDHSFHVRGEAADIRIVGMSTMDSKALANAQGVPGLGYYPVSKMIHVDVRETHYRWTDWTGPASARRK